MAFPLLLKGVEESRRREAALETLRKVGMADRAQHLPNQLSGGQSRALMIADIALLCDSPIVLIDEIENAGIDKERALGLLQRHDKLVLVVTHDPHTALMSRRRIVMGGGAVAAVVERSPQEAALYIELGELYRRQQTYQASLRRGDHLA